MAADPDFDMRRVKLLEDGWYSVESKAGLDNPDRLCSHCGREFCMARHAIDDNEDTVDLKAVRCKLFVPLIPFRVLHGLDQPTFNTIRLGAAWYNRVQIGKRVALVNSANGEIIRRMLVGSKYMGLMKDMLEVHAVSNHALLGREVEEPAAEMFRILRNAHGTMFTKPDRVVSVIYLEDPKDGDLGY